MKKIAIIGASYLQLHLIRKAKKMGFETHVFAWKANDVGEKEADVFYPISIVEKDLILEKCREIGIDGICSIASDLAIITVNYVAQSMGLISNSLDCTARSTNKHLMRRCFEENGDPSPKSLLIADASDPKLKELSYPVIVKPTDRSGSRGITKLETAEGLEDAIENAKAESFEKKALVEEFAGGQEYSVECVSWKGQHYLLMITKKYTTGAPHFIETGHLEPAPLSSLVWDKVRSVTFHALDSLGIEYGASHTEVKIDDSDRIRIIEIGGRMGGDFIGSNLVELSCGFDFVKAVIETSMGIEPRIDETSAEAYSGVRFVFDKNDIGVFEKVKADSRVELIDSDIDLKRINDKITDSSNRHGYFIMRAKEEGVLDQYLI